MLPKHTYKQSFGMLLIFLGLLFLAAACTPVGNEPPAAATGQGQLPTLTPSATPQPAIEVTSEPIATLEPTPEPTHEPTSEPTPETSQELVGTMWDLISFAGQSPIAGFTLTLSFEADGQLGGSAGCNSFFGSYTLEGTTLTIGQMGSTMMACMDNGVMEQESAYLGWLAAATGYTLLDGQLTIHTAQGDLQFQTPTHQSLEGVTWVLNGLVQGEAVVSSWIDSTITATFSDGQVTGSAGCNSYFASYTVTDSALTLGMIGSTDMACDEEHGQREAEFLGAMGAVASFQIERDSLTLLDANGQPLLMFQAQKAG